MIKTCENCKKEWNAKRSSKRFCGTECYMDYRAIGERVCARISCKTEFTSRESGQKYCSRSCSAKVNNSKHPKRKKSSRGKCFCGKFLTKSQSQCCSIKHSQLYRRAYYLNDWIDGTNSGSDKSGSLSKVVRAFLIQMAGHKCTECGWNVPNPVIGRPILTVDHVDGNWKNNSIDNLKVLCYNCHTLTSTFNGLNIGNGAGVRGSGNRAYKDRQHNAPLV